MGTSPSATGYPVVDISTVVTALFADFSSVIPVSG